MGYRICLLAVFASLLLSVPLSRVSAEEVWVFHLERVGDGIMLDTAMTDPVTKIDDPAFSLFEFSKAPRYGAYNFDLYDESGAKTVSTNLDIPQGKFPFEVPYSGTSDRFQVTLARGGTVVLEGNLSAFMKCDMNGTCEFEKGENMDTCVSDCVTGDVKFSSQTLRLLDRGNGSIRDPESGAELLRKVGPEVPSVRMTDSGRVNEGPSQSGYGGVLVLVNWSLGIIAILAVTVFLYRGKR